MGKCVEVLSAGEIVIISVIGGLIGLGVVVAVFCFICTLYNERRWCFKKRGEEEGEGNVNVNRAETGINNGNRKLSIKNNNNIKH